jgi:hypothetical protein
MFAPARLGGRAAFVEPRLNGAHSREGSRQGTVYEHPATKYLIEWGCSSRADVFDPTLAHVGLGGLSWAERSSRFAWRGGTRRRGSLVTLMMTIRRLVLLRGKRQSVRPHTERPNNSLHRTRMQPVICFAPHRLLRAGEFGRWAAFFNQHPPARLPLCYTEARASHGSKGQGGERVERTGGAHHH